MIFQIFLLFFTTFITVFFYNHYGARETLNRILFGILFCLNTSFSLNLSPGIPPLTFFLVSLIPLVFLAYTKEIIKFRFCLPDFFVFVISFLIWAVSGVTTDPKLSVIVFSDWAVYTLVPYFLIRLVVSPKNVLRSLFWIALFISIVALFSPLEYFFNFRYSIILQYLWPTWVMEGAFVREGGFRVFSVYGHPIAAAMIFGIGLFVGFLLLRLNIFKTKFLPIFIVVANAFAVYFTVSRSVIGLALPVILIINFAFVKRKFLYGCMLVVALTFTLAIALPALDNYSKITDYKHASEQQTSAEYRSRLFPTYWPVILERPLTGWGYYYPSVDKLGSIDNYYLLMGLMYGLPIVFLFIIIISTVVVMAFFSWSRSTSERDKKVLWTLISLLLFYSIMMDSVWIFSQSKAMLFIILALTVNIISRERTDYKKYIVFPRTL